jgi:hypothetical protein
MLQRPILLDNEKHIILDPNNPPFENYQSLRQSYFGLRILANTVRNLEIQKIMSDPMAAETLVHFESDLPTVIPCAFNWFSVTLVTYLRLIGLIDLMWQKKWKSSDVAEPANRKAIRLHCSGYVQEAVPDIYRWRNKVAAHAAATDPFAGDTLGTLEQSIMNFVVYKDQLFYAGAMTLVSGNTVAELPEWSLTETYSRLRKRFWPEMQLAEIPSRGA